MIYEFLMQQKHSHTIEIELHLFEGCNLSCGFCCQEHDDFDFNNNRLQEKLKILGDFIDSKMAYSIENNSNWTVNIMGGELFADQNPDAFFDLYQECVDFCQKTIPRNKLDISLTTNLVFTKRKRVMKFLSDNQINLTVSYDFAGRNWSKSQFSQYKENLKFFKDDITRINMTLHRPAIKRMIAQKDIIFDYFYHYPYPIDFTWYVPDLKNSKHYMPNDDDCLMALQFLRDNYPKVDLISNLINNDINPIQCCSENRILIDAFNNTSNCMYLDYGQKNFSTPIDRDSTKSLFHSYIEKKGCLTCQHFNKCGLYCFVAEDFKHKQENALCFLKEFLNETVKESI